MKLHTALSCPLLISPILNPAEVQTVDERGSWWEESPILGPTEAVALASLRLGDIFPTPLSGHDGAVCSIGSGGESRGNIPHSQPCRSYVCTSNGRGSWMFVRVLSEILHLTIGPYATIDLFFLKMPHTFELGPNIPFLWWNQTLQKIGREYLDQVACFCCRIYNFRTMLMGGLNPLPYGNPICPLYVGKIKCAASNHEVNMLSLALRCNQLFVDWGPWKSTRVLTERNCQLYFFVNLVLNCSNLHLL